MGCCILGAIVIARCIETFERVQRLFAPVTWLLRAVTPAALGRGKPFFVAAVIELTVLMSLAWAHSDHLLAALHFAGDQIPAALCVGGDVPEIAAAAPAAPPL
jgi:hypothetical protein